MSRLCWVTEPSGDVSASCPCFLPGWNEAAAHLPATPVEFKILGWEPYSEWEALDVMRISTVFSLLLNRGFTIDFCRALLKKELGEYWEVSGDTPLWRRYAVLSKCFSV